MKKLRKFLPLIVGVCSIVLDNFFEIEDPNVQCAFVGAIIGAVGSIAGGVAGAISGNKRRKEAETAMATRQRKLDAWRDAEIGGNYLDRADSRAAMRRVFEYNKEAKKGADTNAIKRGLTDEGKVAQASRLNKNYADAVSQISAAGQRHKDMVQSQYMAETRDLDSLKIQNLMDTSGVDNMVGGITGALGSLGQIDFGGGKSVAGNIGISQNVKDSAANYALIPKNNKINI